ncbi:unnamed protein product [Gongylonema pulchrum]|uniref:Uncharacterized protein n=1 Tax=Gongylonema pulchrum TaxID=637853 RepID=A0A183EVM3_9BILA|nr:unnamed protein product [Gongylonema pulchrum]
MEMNDSQCMEEGLAMDDEHVYANVQEMEEESRRREQPPIPEPMQQPVRDVGGGWFEYITESGRSEFPWLLETV